MPWAQSEKRLEAEIERLKEEVQRQAKLAADAEAKLKTAEAEQAKAAAVAETKRTTKRFD